MKITKFGHSCLLAEHSDRVALYDPGIFTWQMGKLDLDKIDRVDRIIITHPHPDHLYPEALKAVLAKFPDAQIICNDASKQVIQENNIEARYRDASQCSCQFEAPHRKVEPLGITASNNGYHFKDLLTHPGDSYDFDETKEILAMPFVAPWGTVVEALKKTIDLKPRHVIPIHDWFWSDQAQDWLYNRLSEALKQHEILLHPLKAGDSVEI